MKYLRQGCVILLFSFLGELCHWLIPWPVPASIYGMILLFGALTLKIIPFRWVQDTGGYLVSILPVLFVAPAVGILNCWEELAANAVAVIVIVVVSTVITFGVSGAVTQWLMNRGWKTDA